MGEQTPLYSSGAPCGGMLIGEMLRDIVPDPPSPGWLNSAIDRKVIASRFHAFMAITAIVKVTSSFLRQSHQVRSFCTRLFFVSSR